MARHICVILHGIECLPEDRLWSEELATRIYPHAAGLIEFLPRKYGYIPGWRVNYFSVYRSSIVDHEEAYFKALRADVGPDCNISVICHSLGGYIVSELLQRGLKFHRVISLYAAAPQNTDWTTVENNFDRIYVWWSKNDEILPQSRFGKIGLVGPLRQHPRVVSIKTQHRHTTFMDDHEMYKLIPTWVKELEE